MKINIFALRLNYALIGVKSALRRKGLATHFGTTSDFFFAGDAIFFFCSVAPTRHDKMSH